MESFGPLDIFVRVGESRSFTAVAQQLGISASAVSKAIARLEERLSTRLLHRSTRTVTLTPEGSRFLEHCRRILGELELAQDELALAQRTPRGKLRVSLPSANQLLMPLFAQFNRLYPEIQLDIDCSDRLVDVIEEGFDAVIRTGEPRDSRLSARLLGAYRRTIVAAPAYLERHGVPRVPADLLGHRCLLYRYPSSGKLDVWPLCDKKERIVLELPEAMVCNSLEPQLCFAEAGLGIACVPDTAILRQLQAGTLLPLLEEFNWDSTSLYMLWPSSKHLSPKLRLFIDYLAEHLPLANVP